MNFFVSDILSLSQINQKKLRKNISRFDLQDTINEVIQVQEHKANALGIKIETEFINFKEKRNTYMICTDELRLQQVLINF